MLRLTSLLVLVFFTLPMSAVSNNPSIAAKAARFFSHGEWANAGAMYSLMIDEQPANADTYGHAIVVAAMLGDTIHQIDLTHRALKALVPVDSIFTSVRNTSFSIGQTDLYRDYLISMKQAEPWHKRTINGYLLRYYTYRRNAAGMIEMSTEMLHGLPDDEKFLYPLAQGYLIKGDFNNAMATYTRIININPQAYEALLYLGNYHATKAKSDATSRSIAIGYLKRAQAIKDTPIINATISSLENIK